MQVALEVSAPAAWAVMTDISALAQINPNVELAEAMPGDRLHSIVKLCVALICRSIEQVQHVQQFAGQSQRLLRMVIDPELSDLRYGVAEWRFLPRDADSSELTFDAELAPKFWVPPLIGPWLVQRKLAEQARITSHGIERVARERGY